MALFSRSELFEALREINIIPEAKLTEAFNESKKKNLPLEDVILDHDLISDVNLGKLISEITSVPFVDLSGVHIDEEVLALVPEVFAKARHIIAFKLDTQGLHVATSDPSDVEAAKFLGKKVGLPVKIYYSPSRALSEAFNLYSKTVEQAFDEILKGTIADAAGSGNREPSIVKIVDTIVSYAYKNKASDIHMEPMSDTSIVRFRVDGILHDIISFPINLHPQIVTRIKVMSRLRTDEHHAAQDGRVTFKLPEEDLDIRVSIVPVTKGEKIVMRLLSEKSRRFSLTDLGFSDRDLAKVNDAYRKPHGMILATGPTGSGKTTTLYALLKLLNKRDVNIMTIEDPVEYEIDGVNQIQVNTKTNLTFSEGLRSIVRQNPDIILVGEIRDTDTASIAINAAMTGHLVLSTLHTNDAATAFPRLLDFGVESYLVASTVNLVIAQRLVRKICLQCRYSYEVNLAKVTKDDPELGALKQISEPLIKKYLGDSPAIRVYKGKGCQVCHGTGYTGREGIYEVLVMNEGVRAAIMAKKDASEVNKEAVLGGMVSMIENGLEKVRSGVTTLEEVVRVIKE